jgi:hypothetical protein
MEFLTFFLTEAEIHHAIAQVDRYYFLNVEPHVHSQVISRQIRGKRCGNELGFPDFLQFSPANHHSIIAPYSSVTMI